MLAARPRTVTQISGAVFAFTHSLLTHSLPMIYSMTGYAVASRELESACCCCPEASAPARGGAESETARHDGSLPKDGGKAVRSAATMLGRRNLARNSGAQP